MEASLSTKRHERDLVQRAQQGDRQAFAALYEMFADRLYRQVLYPCAPDPHTAEDLLKETFVTVLERIHTFRWDERYGLFPWLARIAQNRATDRHRKRASEGRAQGAYRQHLELLATRDTPEGHVSEEEERQHLQQRIKTQLDMLNPRYKQAIELRLFQELSREECAAQLDVTIGTFDVLMYRAIRAFRKQWETQIHDELT